MDTMELTWRQRLVKEYNKPYFQRLVQFLATEARSHTIYPPADQIFTALNLCPYDNVKVVIIGQDPYHGPGQAHGLAFSVQRGVPPPPSLKNIFTELQTDIGISKPSHGNLEHWSRQGVILLNTALTVRKGEANSHQKKG
ncbi:uracil-DNA glycosylase [archaeon]|nr:MAG: uracil-DNA glycosylase [archaeon]